ncbi:hypothetical protein, partial [Limnohabitans radicicola]|uniref:hypothetical protein n=1 Tax=Limnohabitans radicicola TaxID=2771427 RepID=UPI001CD86E6A
QWADEAGDCGLGAVHQLRLSKRGGPDAQVVEYVSSKETLSPCRANGGAFFFGGCSLQSISFLVL